MSDLVEIEYDNPNEQAVLLLAAADDLGITQLVVETTTKGFRVPQEVYDKAFGKSKAAAKAETKPEAKKAPAKTEAKKTSKKTTAKKAPAKKTK